VRIDMTVDLRAVALHRRITAHEVVVAKAACADENDNQQAHRWRS
jgi:hypothetical protein